MAGVASGPEPFSLLLRPLMKNFDGVDPDDSYTELHTIVMCNGTPFSGFNREFLVFLPTTTGSERVLSPGTDVVLDVVRVGADEQFPPPMPAVYPGSTTTDPRPYALLHAL